MDVDGDRPATNELVSQGRRLIMETQITLGQIHQSLLPVTIWIVIRVI